MATTPTDETGVPPARRTYRHSEAAEYLGMTERQLGLARLSGRITWAKPGKYVVFTQEWLDEFLAGSTIERRS